MSVDEMLKRLRPLMNHDFIISEIVMMELRNHYETTHQVVARSLEKLEQRMDIFADDSEVKDSYLKFCAALKNKKASPTSCDKFIAQTNTTVVPYINVSLEYVMTAYFDTIAPFQTGKKKREFPDAVALFSLDKWAEENNRRIAAISCDNDWLTFAELNRGRWDCYKSIEQAAAKLK
jgi:hypothetical protein